MRIALLDTYIRYTPRDAYCAPLGGTETSFVHLAEALQANGHEVRVYLLEPGTDCFRNVYYHRSEEFGRHSCEVVVGRWPQLFQRVGERFRKRIWWCHKPVDAGSVAAAQKYRVYPVVTSRYQAEQLTDLGWRGGFDVVPLGCRLLRFAGDGNRREPFSAVWISALDRGLSSLIDIWRRLRRHARPEAKLVVAGGPAIYKSFGDYMKSTEDRLRRETADESDIEWVGALAPQELFALLSRCGFMPYTALAPESFCLAVLEAQAAGCLPLVPPLGALKERVVHGRTGWIAPLQGMEDRMLEYMEQAHDGTIADMRLEAQRAARRFTWTGAAKGFEAAIANCVATTL